MPDMTLSGGCRWNDLCAVDVTMDPATGDPLTCKNPNTGAEISGGGDSYATVEVTALPDSGTMFSCAICSDSPEGTTTIVKAAAGTNTYKIPLYNGKAIVDPMGSTYTLTGDIVEDGGVLIVTGDGTATFVE
jgi:hypothetical protein